MTVYGWCFFFLFVFFFLVQIHLFHFVHYPTLEQLKIFFQLGCKSLQLIKTYCEPLSCFSAWYAPRWPFRFRCTALSWQVCGACVILFVFGWRIKQSSMGGWRLRILSTEALSDFYPCTEQTSQAFTEQLYWGWILNYTHRLCFLISWQ